MRAMIRLKLPGSSTIVQPSCAVRGHPRCAAFVEPLLPRLADRAHADNVELSEPLTSEGAITKSPNRFAEVRAVRGTGPPFGQNHHAVRASRHFFRGQRPRR
jgi:hypothetical protein